MAILFKIDFHVHCAEHSACATHCAVEMAAAAVAAGLDAVAFCNHDSYLDDGLLARLRSSFPSLRIYNGIEISVDDEHALCLGLVDLALCRWRQGWPALIRRVRAKGGAIILAHPFRFGEPLHSVIGAYRPNGVETQSSNLRPEPRRRAALLADSLSLPGFANSDAHSPHVLGVCHNLFDTLPADGLPLAAAVRAFNGKFFCDETAIAKLQAD